MWDPTYNTHIFTTDLIYHPWSGAEQHRFCKVPGTDLSTRKILSLDNHINKVTKKAHNTLSCLGRIISRYPTNIKAQCYSILVRPSLEYASTVWCQAKKGSIRQIEAVQQMAARFATGDYHRTSCVFAIMQQLNSAPLEVRRNKTRFVMMHRIVYNLVDIPPAPYLQQTPLYSTHGQSIKFLVPDTRTSVFRNSLPSSQQIVEQPARILALSGRSQSTQLQGSDIQARRFYISCNVINL